MKENETKYVKPPIIYRIGQKIKRVGAKLNKPKLNKEMRRKLKNENFTIISSNCIAGIIYHDLGMEFNTPTVNMFFDAEDYIRFVENLKYYISLPINVKIEEGFSYPIGTLDDIKIHFLHYKDSEECIYYWNRRKERINYDNLLITMTDRDGVTDEIVHRFSQLPYKKVMYTCKPYDKYDCVCYVPDFKKAGQVGIMTGWADFKGNRYYEKYFDIIKWINQ